MRTRLTQKQERFCLAYIELGNGTQAAITAGYSHHSAHPIATENLRKPAIQARLKQLRQRTEDETIMGVLERKRKLTEIARARLTDFMELGQDGSWVNIGPEVPMAGAIQEIRSKTEYEDDGSKPTVHTSVKLHNPIQAIDLLNKMDKIYTDGAQVNVDNRKIEIIVYDRETGALVQRLVNGEQPEFPVQIDAGIPG